jgi:hypothetical protein
MFEQPSETTVRGNVFLTASMSSASGLLEKLLQAATAANNSDRAKARSTLESALSLLMTSREALKVLNPCRTRGGLAPWQAKRVAAYIREHIGSRLTASELALLVGFGYSHFNRAWHSVLPVVVTFLSGLAADEVLRKWGACVLLAHQAGKEQH